jgi:hypothetical protein
MTAWNWRSWTVNLWFWINTNSVSGPFVSNPACLRIWSARCAWPTLLFWLSIVF